MSPSRTSQSSRRRPRRDLGPAVESLESRALLTAAPVLYDYSGKVEQLDWRDGVGTGSPVQNIPYSHAPSDNLDWEQDLNSLWSVYPDTYVTNTGKTSNGGADLDTTTDIGLQWVAPKDDISLNWPWFENDLVVEGYVRGGPGTPYSITYETHGLTTNGGYGAEEYWNHSSFPVIDVGSGTPSSAFSQPTTPPKVINGKSGGTPIVVGGVTYTRVLSESLIGYVDVNGSYPLQTHLGWLEASTHYHIQIQQGVAPVASIDGPDVLYVGQQGTYRSLSYDPDNGGTTPGNGIINYQWSYEPVDDLLSATSTAYVTPDHPGTYELNLTVTDDEGMTSTTSRTIEVRAPAIHLVSVDDHLDPDNPVLTFQADGAFSAVELIVDGGAINSVISNVPPGSNQITLHDLERYPLGGHSVVIQGVTDDTTVQDGTVVDTSRLVDRVASYTDTVWMDSGLSSAASTHYTVRSRLVLHEAKWLWSLPGSTFDRLILGADLDITSTIPLAYESYATPSMAVTAGPWAGASSSYAFVGITPPFTTGGSGYSGSYTLAASGGLLFAKADATELSYTLAGASIGSPYSDSLWYFGSVFDPNKRTSDHRFLIP